MLIFALFHLAAETFDLVLYTGDEQDLAQPSKYHLE
jgi:hypothetical protein